MKTIAIVGAGVGGMAAAWDLRKAGHTVTIYEGSDSVGGLAGGFRLPGWDWSVEKYYHHWFQTDKDILGLIRELGWEEDVIFPRPKTVVYTDGKFAPLDSPLAALTFPGLTCLILPGLDSPPYICVTFQVGVPWKNSPPMNGCARRMGISSTSCCLSRSCRGSSAATIRK